MDRDLSAIHFPAFRCNLFIFKGKIKRISTAIRAKFSSFFVFANYQNPLKIQSKTKNLKKTSTFATQTKK